MNAPKFAGTGRLIQRKRIVRTIGLDSDIFLALVNDDEDFTLFRPRIFNRKNTVFINYRVFGETLGVLINKYGYSEKSAVDKIFEFLRKNNIILLKKKQTDLVQVSLIFEGLKRYRQAIGSLAGDSDLKIISIYRVHNIDCIMSRNSTHLLPFCRHLHIEFEKLQENVDIMFRQAFGWQRRKRR